MPTWSHLPDITHLSSMVFIILDLSLQTSDWSVNLQIFTEHLLCAKTVSGAEENSREQNRLLGREVHSNQHMCNIQIACIDFPYDTVGYCKYSLILMQFRKCKNP